MRDLEIPEKRRSHVITRDLFLFACYTGTAYADAVSITRENLFTDDEGSLWLKYRRKKTDYLGRVKLLPEALALIEKYRDDTRAIPRNPARREKKPRNVRMPMPMMSTPRACEKP